MVSALLSPPLRSPATSPATSLEGMANPMFSAELPDGVLPAAAVFMPMTSPAELSNGPPEFPGLMAASVWISPPRVSVPPPELSPAVI